MQALDKLAVQLAAQDLIEESNVGQTTTLDVKNRLRGQNYWATQDAVSQLMEELSADGVLSWHDSGFGYRIYEESVLPSLPLQSLYTAVNQQKTQPQVTYKDCDVVDEGDPLADSASCGWLCTCYSDKQAPQKLVISDKPINRNTARQAYAVMLGKPYHDVRAVQTGL